jgi:uncharacterized glyoxalase superfamily protein PhnB
MKLGYTLIYVEDVVKTVEHYEACYGLLRRFVSDEQDYAEMDTGATTLSFVRYDLASQSVDDYRPNDPNHAPAGVEIAFLAEDVPAAYLHAVTHGATPLMEPITKLWGQVVAYVRDLNGVLIEICSPMGS